MIPLALLNLYAVAALLMGVAWMLAWMLQGAAETRRREREAWEWSEAIGRRLADPAFRASVRACIRHSQRHAAGDGR